jgi:hypothetical protein
VLSCVTSNVFQCFTLLMFWPMTLLLTLLLHYCHSIVSLFFISVTLLLLPPSAKVLVTAGVVGTNTGKVDVEYLLENERAIQEAKTAKREQVLSAVCYLLSAVCFTILTLLLYCFHTAVTLLLHVRYRRLGLASRATCSTKCECL